MFQIILTQQIVYVFCSKDQATNFNANIAGDDAFRRNNIITSCIKSKKNHN